MTRVLCAEQITDPDTTIPGTLFIVEIGVNAQPKIIFEKGSPSNAQISATTGAKYYKITAAGQPSESKEQATQAQVQAEPAQAAVSASIPQAQEPAPAQAAPAQEPTLNPVPDKVCGLTNPGSMCYLNTAIQLLLDIPEIPEYFSKTTDIAIVVKSPQCETMPTVTQVTEYKKNIKLLQHIFNTIKIDSAKNPQTPTDIIKIKTPGTQPGATPNAENTAYYELAKEHQVAFLNDQDRLKQEVLQNIHLYDGLTPANIDKYIEDEIAPLEKKYSQADPGEFLSALFFPNFLCVDAPNNFTKIIGLNESSEIECENKTKYDTASVYSPIIELRTDKTNKSISDLLEKHKEIEQIDGKSDQCKTDTDPNVKQQTKQIKHTLQRNPDTKYIILYLNRNMYDNTGQEVRNNTTVDITNEITIDKVQFRRKGCIFHTGNVTGGHYVYGSYDKDGNPKHVRDDAQIIEASSGIAPKVFAQNGYLSTLCLYERIEDQTQPQTQTQTQTQTNKGGSAKTKKRKNKNKKRKTQHKKRN